MGFVARIQVQGHGRIAAGLRPALQFRRILRQEFEDASELDHLHLAKASQEKQLMKKERKIIVYIATSADGYIARRDHGIDWLNRPRTAGDYGMGAFFRTIDTILWGRKTYDIGMKMDSTKMFSLKVKNFVFSHRAKKSAAPGFEFVKDPVPAFAKGLRRQPGKHIWMMGGG